MLFNELMINIIKTLTNNHVSFKLDNVNERLKIIQHQSIVDIFASFNIFNNEFQNDNKGQKEVAFIIYKNIFNNILNIEFNYRYRKK